MNNPFSQQYVAKNCLIKYPDMVTGEKRKDTYTNWFPVQDSDELVNCGFFYRGQGDRVTCFYCGLTLTDWLEEDDPWIEHARFAGNCPYMLLNVRRRRAKYLRTKFVKDEVLKIDKESTPSLKTICKICMDNEIEYVTFPCTHFSMCSKCVTTQNYCPICKQKIEKFLHVFIP